jgi:hypothetical protein
MLHWYLCMLFRYPVFSWIGCLGENCTNVLVGFL